ncbi:MAG: radical SAM protein [Elusimicrobia bacterium]|nr:radical SAM protein [Elusimicrobiota bacterium]
MPTDRIDNSAVLENARLNEEEYRERKVCLKSYPQAIFVQVDGPCNHECLFCSRPKVYSHFDLDRFRSRYEDLLMPVLTRVSRINITGSGELLFLPEAKRNLDYFNRYVHAEKMFATNGSSLVPKMVDHIAVSGNRYTIHVSLHSSNENLHRLITASNSYPVVMENLKYIKKVKREIENLRINYIFVMTSQNARNLKDFIRLAYGNGADGVVVYYYYVYRLDQKSASCYFIKDAVNDILREAEEELDSLTGKDGRQMDLILPPRFGVEYEMSGALCKEAWSQVMVNSGGDIISCDVAGDSRENISGKSDFMEVWNGRYYIDLRRNLIEGKYDCASFCWRANPNTVNDFRSHVITRGKSEEEIRELLEVTEE